MQRLLIIAAAALVLFGSSRVSTQKPSPTLGPVTVFLNARPAPPPIAPAEINLLKEKAKAARVAMDELGASYRAKYGKYEKWPPDARQAFTEAFYGMRTAASSVWCANVPAEDLSASLTDLRKDIEKWVAKKGWVKAVETRDEADVIVEIAGRSTQVRTLGDALFQKASFLGGSRVITVDVLPGRIGLGTLSKVPFEWPNSTSQRADPTVFGDHWFTAAEPFFRFTVGDDTRWSLASQKAAFMLQDFAKDNYETLKAK